MIDEPHKFSGHVPCCRKCGGGIFEIHGYLRRVNPKGEVPAIWECHPSCDAQLTNEQAIIAAIEGPPSKE